MRDNGQATGRNGKERFQTVDGFAADYYYRCAVMAATLVRLGDIPQEELTAELLHDNMTPDDFNILLASRNVLKVKRNGGESRLAGLRLAVLILGATEYRRANHDHEPSRAGRLACRR